MSQKHPGATLALPDGPPPLDQRAAWRQRWNRRALIALAVLAYEVIWVATAFDKVNPTDLDIFFFPASRIALAGHLFNIYELRVGLIYTNANGPFSLIPVLVAAWIANLRGWIDDPILRRALVFALSGPFQLLAGWEAARIVERFGGRLRGLARVLPYLPFLFAPELWLSALYYGHIEQTIAVWLVLAAIRLLGERRVMGAGALLGLALMSRSDVAILLLPIAITLLFRRQFSETIRLAVGGAITSAAVIAPFLIADPRDTIFSLVSFRSTLPIGGGNFWSLNDSTPFLLFGQRYDSVLAIGMAILFTLIVLISKRDLTVTSPDLFLLLALTSLCFVLLIKTLWPYYYQEAALLATAWALARSASPLTTWSRAWLPRIGALALLWLPRIVILACALFAEYSLEVTNYSGWISPWGTIEGLNCIVVVAITAATLLGAPSLLTFLAPKPPVAQRDILPEIALDAQADGEGQPLSSR